LTGTIVSNESRPAKPFDHGDDTTSGATAPAQGTLVIQTAMTSIMSPKPPKSSALRQIT
jgi:hypothetical protein